MYLAWEQKADAVEVDIHLTRDGHIVVIHDDNTRRVARVDKKISEQTLRELRRLDVGKWQGKQWVGERIPTLDEVLATVPSGGRLFIEIKCGPEFIPAFAEVLERSGRKPPQIVPIGFSLLTMKLVKRRFPELEVCRVMGFKRNWKTGRWSPTPAELIEQAKDAGLDGLDLGARGPIDARFVKRVKDAGLKLYVWTVDSPAKARKMAEAGVDGITTNRPGRLRKLLHLR